MKRIRASMYLFLCRYPYLSPFFVCLVLVTIFFFASGVYNNDFDFLANLIGTCIISFLISSPFIIATLFYNIYSSFRKIEKMEGGEQEDKSEADDGASIESQTTSTALINTSIDSYSYVAQKKKAAEIIAKEEREHKEALDRIWRERIERKNRILSYSNYMPNQIVLIYAAYYSYLFKLITVDSLMLAMPFADGETTDYVLSTLCKEKILVKSSDGLTYGCRASQKDVDTFCKGLLEKGEDSLKEYESPLSKWGLENDPSLWLDIACTFYMNNSDFRRFCSSLLIDNGFKNMFWVGGRKDGGIDFMAEKNGVSYAIQCKCYTSGSNAPFINATFSCAAFPQKKTAVLMTNCIYTDSAKKIAEDLNVSIWDYNTLQNMLGRYSFGKQ